MLDIIMLILFVLFMVFVFGGYHKNKSAQREAQFKKELEEKEKIS
jgi:Ca2+/Na+ antiporter